MAALPSNSAHRFVTFHISPHPSNAQVQHIPLSPFQQPQPQPQLQSSVEGAIGVIPVDAAVTTTVTGDAVVIDGSLTLCADVAELKRLKTLQDLAPSSPPIKLFIDTVTLVVDMFRLSMATMLAVFVPQLCPGAEEEAAQGNFGCTHELVPHDCTFQENFVCLSQFNKVVLSWNFICLGLLVFHYFLVWRREKFLIRHFRETLTVSRLNIRDILHEYPGLKRKLGMYNRWVFYTSVVAIVLQVANVILSGILVMQYYNNGYKTFTTFFTNLLVIMMVLYMCLSAAFVGLKHELAYSCVAVEPISYNTVGPGAKKNI